MTKPNSSSKDHVDYISKPDLKDFNTNQVNRNKIKAEKSDKDLIFKEIQDLLENF